MLRWFWWTWPLLRYKNVQAILFCSSLLLSLTYCFLFRILRVLKLYPPVLSYTRRARLHLSQRHEDGKWCLCWYVNNRHIRVCCFTCPSWYSCLLFLLDFDECTSYGICDQKCSKKPGGYQCYCDPGYALQKDGHSCKADGKIYICLI